MIHHEEHSTEHEKHEKPASGGKLFPLLHTLVIVGIGVLLVTNSILLGSITSAVSQAPVQIEDGMMDGGASTTSTDIDASIIPQGVPRLYGKEIGISFDDVSSQSAQKADSTIKRLGVLDQQITLSGGDKERYIRIASKISCEYCCGAPSIISPTGEAACGCAHSFAMRGLAKYLITQHPQEFTDDEILEELGKWKTLFFPGPISQKAKILKSKGIPLNYINLASNKYRGIEQGASSGDAMVGGC